MSVLLGTHFSTDDLGVWIPKAGIETFGYTDGVWFEHYLERVLRQSNDISSDSEELETYIKDWTTEYHLSRKRKDLLTGLTHNRRANVLEIGCGCGAITRFLGENYDSVVAVEGSYNRARIAKLRTAGLLGVEVVASRYQDLGLEGTFDIVFCVGVLEYAPTYIDAPDPFRHALESMRNMLKPDGTLVIAIENKFGLKYFANSREDHAGTFFEGIEGYPRAADKFKTFGRKEFGELLSAFWPTLQFYYPFPDYKLPSMLLSDETLHSINPGEMLASLKERDYGGTKHPFFDNRLAWTEIARNGLVAEFSNSFLVVAGSNNKLAPSMEGRLGVLFNRDRRAKFSTKSIIEKKNGSVIVTKALAQGKSGYASTKHIVVKEDTSPWIGRETVAYSLFRGAHNGRLSLIEQLYPVRMWWECILSRSFSDFNGTHIPGEMIDAVWHNSCVMPDQSVAFFDQEMIWNENILAQDIFLRAVFHWIERYSKSEMRYLGTARSITAIRRIAAILDIKVSHFDIIRVAKREAKIQSEIGTIVESSAYVSILAQLYVPYFALIIGFGAKTLLQTRRVQNLLRRVIGA
jgi:SAM-dependent methyltransferase